MKNEKEQEYTGRQRSKRRYLEDERRMKRKVVIVGRR